jgi:probable phosphoglycerate mutase
VADPPRRRALNAATPLIPAGLDATLVLVRHGESTFIVEGRFQGQAETPLSATGVRQAELAAARLAVPHEAPRLPVPSGAPREVVHSPLARTTQTADAVGRALAAHGSSETATRVRPDPGFLEIGQGEWEGLHHSLIAERYGETLSAWRIRPTEAWAPGGESLGEVQVRVRPSLAAMLRALARGGVPGRADRSQVAGYREPEADHPWSVLVAHDGVFKVVLLTLFDLPLDHFWMWSFDLCGISVVELRGGRPILRTHNLTEHLAPLFDERAQEALEERRRSGAL